MKMGRARIYAAVFCFAIFSSTAVAQEWLKLTPASGEAPTPRRNAAAIYDSLDHRMIIFGGRTNAGDRNEVWAFDLSSNTWEELTPAAGDAPAPRFTANGIYDAANHRMLIWSGQGASFFNDVWTFDLTSNAWSQFTPPDPKPNIRYGTAAIFDPHARDLVTFAGFTDQGRFDDTWRFDIDAAIWAKLQLDTYPEKRCLHTSSYDALNHRMIVYGGQTNGPRGDIWAFDLHQNHWTDLTPDNRPAGRWFAASIYEGREHRFIIFGGNLGGSQTNEVRAFRLNEGNWEQLSPTGEGPAAREGAAAIYVEKENRMVVFGGRGASDFNDVWSLNNLARSTGVEGDDNIPAPQSFRLLGNYPNPLKRSLPFNETVIVYELAQPAHVLLTIYNVIGQPVKNLFNRRMAAGQHRVRWDGRDEAGKKVSSGIYLYRLQSGGAAVFKKMILVD